MNKSVSIPAEQRLSMSAKPPDPRAVAAAANAGYDIGTQIARQINDQDFQTADYLIVMDRGNLTTVQGWAPAESQAEIALLLSFGDHLGETQVPDPYYQDAERFGRVVKTLEKASDALLDHICRVHRLETISA